MVRSTCTVRQWASTLQVCRDRSDCLKLLTDHPRLEMTPRDDRRNKPRAIKNRNVSSESVPKSAGLYYNTTSLLRQINPWMVDNDGTTAATTATETYPTLILLHLYRSIHAPGLDYGAKKSGERCPRTWKGRRCRKKPRPGSSR